VTPLRDIHALGRAFAEAQVVGELFSTPIACAPRGCAWSTTAERRALGVHATLAEHFAPDQPPERVLGDAPQQLAWALIRAEERPGSFVHLVQAELFRSITTTAPERLLGTLERGCSIFHELDRAQLESVLLAGCDTAALPIAQGALAEMSTYAARHFAAAEAAHVGCFTWCSAQIARCASPELWKALGDGTAALVLSAPSGAWGWPLQLVGQMRVALGERVLARFAEGEPHLPQISGFATTQRQRQRVVDEHDLGRLLRRTVSEEKETAHA
jgi:hypothetical protein